MSLSTGKNTSAQDHRMAAKETVSSIIDFGILIKGDFKITGKELHLIGPNAPLKQSAAT